MKSKYLGGLQQRRDILIVQIQELNVELTGLNNVISDLEYEAVLAGTDKTLTRKNRRQLVFTGLIRLMLSPDDRDAGLRTREIYDRLTVDYGDLKYASLRSYLHRMKTDGQIYQRWRGAPWQLTELKK